MKIAIGTDHRGFDHKEYIKTICKEYEWLDVGAYNDERSDYPVFAQQVVTHMLAGTVEYGVLLCSTGIGMAIVANRSPHIYAAVTWNDVIARQAKEEDNCNVLVLPSDSLTPDEAVTIIYTWCNAVFKGGRYAQRLEMIDK